MSYKHFRTVICKPTWLMVFRKRCVFFLNQRRTLVCLLCVLTVQVVLIVCHAHHTRHFLQTGPSWDLDVQDVIGRASHHHQHYQRDNTSVKHPQNSLYQWCAWSLLHDWNNIITVTIARKRTELYGRVKSHSVS